MIVREATIRDAKKIAKIHVDGWRNAYRGLVPDEYLNGLDYGLREKQWNDWILENKLNVLVIECDKTVSGYVSWRKGDGYSKLLGLYIDPQMIGKGIGKKLLTEMTAKCNSSRITLHVLDGNRLGIEFYKRNGFVFTGIFEIVRIANVDLKEFEMLRILSN